MADHWWNKSKKISCERKGRENEKETTRKGLVLVLGREKKKINLPNQYKKTHFSLVIRLIKFYRNITLIHVEDMKATSHRVLNNCVQNRSGFSSGLLSVLVVDLTGSSSVYRRSSSSQDSIHDIKMYKELYYPYNQEEFVYCLESQALDGYIYPIPQDVT